jgi:hypothetical protein
MADKLSDLPTDKTSATPEESELVESLLKMTGESSSDSGGSRWLALLKASLFLTAIFAVVASPIVSGLMKKIPGLGNSAITLVVQSVLFMILTGLSLWWLSS